MSRCGLLVAALFVVPVGVLAASAQPVRDAVAPDPPQTFGITTEIAHVLSAAEFDTETSAKASRYDLSVNPATGFLLRGSGAGGTLVNWFAGLRLPTGAVVTRLEIAGCSTTDLSVAIFRSRLPPKTGFELLAGLSTAAPPTPCGRFSVTPTSPPLVIDSANTTYTVNVSTDPGSSFDSVRVYYQLQVSPAPATATFGDVPTSHPFFQFVEALVDSGITAGCGGGSYCPDAPLTRGQMAVFLSKALGLHFAPCPGQMAETGQVRALDPPGGRS